MAAAYEEKDRRNNPRLCWRGFRLRVSGYGARRRINLKKLPDPYGRQQQEHDHDCDDEGRPELQLHAGDHTPRPLKSYRAWAWSWRAASGHRSRGRDRGLHEAGRV
jgi:hypothetical protein